MKGRLSFLKRHTSRSSRPYEEEDEGRDRKLKEIQLSSVAQKKPRGKSHGSLWFSQQNQRYQKSNDRKEIKKWEMVCRRGNRGWDADEVRVEEVFFFSLNSLQAALKPLIHRRGHAYRESRTNAIVYIKDAEEKKQGSTFSRSTTG